LKAKTEKLKLEPMIKKLSTQIEE